jgi:hypothetical protein
MDAAEYRREIGHVRFHNKYEKRQAVFVRNVSGVCGNEKLQTSEEKNIRMPEKKALRWMEWIPQA